MIGEPVMSTAPGGSNRQVSGPSLLPVSRSAADGPDERAPAAVLPRPPNGIPHHDVGKETERVHWLKEAAAVRWRSGPPRRPSHAKCRSELQS